LPPKSIKQRTTQRVELNEKYKFIRNQVSRERTKIREYSPILESKNLSYYTLSPEKL